MNEHRWFNPNQPQTLQIATIILYIDAVLLIIYGAYRSPIYLAVVAAMALGGYGIANEKKWGYALAVLGAVFNFAVPFLYGVSLGDYLRADPIGFIFSLALVALLLHPMSRDYQRIWFR